MASTANELSLLPQQPIDLVKALGDARLLLCGESWHADTRPLHVLLDQLEGLAAAGVTHLFLEVRPPSEDRKVVTAEYLLGRKLPAGYAVLAEKAKQVGIVPVAADPQAGLGRRVMGNLIATGQGALAYDKAVEIGRLKEAAIVDSTVSALRDSPNSRGIFLCGLLHSSAEALPSKFRSHDLSVGTLAFGGGLQKAIGDEYSDGAEFAGLGQFAFMINGGPSPMAFYDTPTQHDFVAHLPQRRARVGGRIRHSVENLGDVSAVKQELLIERVLRQRDAALAQIAADGVRLGNGYTDTWLRLFTEAAANEEGASLLDLAHAYVAIGDIEQAWEWGRRAIDAGATGAEASFAASTAVAQRIARSAEHYGSVRLGEI